MSAIPQPDPVPRCQRCGLEEGAIADGYPAPEDIALLLDECPPPFLRAFVQAIRDHKASKSSGGGTLYFNGSNGETQEWGMDRTTKSRGLTNRPQR